MHQRSDYDFDVISGPSTRFPAPPAAPLPPAGPPRTTPGSAPAAAPRPAAGSGNGEEA